MHPEWSRGVPDGRLIYMPLPSRPLLRIDDLASLVRDEVFGRRNDASVGIELEWLTTVPTEGHRRLTLGEAETIAATATLPKSSRLTIEPGGQVEISTQPHPSTSEACEAAADDLFALEQRCRAYGIELVALGLDPFRDPQRIVTAARYAAMQNHFDRHGPAGRTMMCNSASIQLNVALGPTSADVAARWRLSHLLGPVVIAAFANSPLAAGRPTGWACTRMRTWWAIDPTRSAPVSGWLDPDLDPADAWLTYALDANVLLQRDEDGAEPLDRPLPFGSWLTNGHDGTWPTLDDARYHLTTLFPPVRPRGWFELRMLDSLPTPWWHVAVAVISTLLDDRDRQPQLESLLDPVAGHWVEASRDGMRDPVIGDTARRLFRLAATALAEAGADDATLAIVDTFRRRYVERSRCPGDDVLDRYLDDGSVLPPAESPVPYAQLEASWR